MREKFARYAGQVLDRSHADDIVALVADLEAVTDMAGWRCSFPPNRCPQRR